jgi:hypothetical protein
VTIHRSNAGNISSLIPGLVKGTIGTRLPCPQQFKISPTCVNFPYTQMVSKHPKSFEFQNQITIISFASILIKSKEEVFSTYCLGWEFEEESHLPKYHGHSYLCDKLDKCHAERKMKMKGIFPKIMNGFNNCEKDNSFTETQDNHSTILLGFDNFDMLQQKTTVATNMTNVTFIICPVFKMHL